MKNQLEFQLSETIQISRKGEFEETATIVVDPPSMDCNDEVSDFEQMFMGAMITAGKLFQSDVIKDAVDSKEEKSAMQELKDNTPSQEEIRMMLFATQEVKFKDLFKAFKKIALKSAYVADGVKMKESHFDKMTRDDSIRFICEYASFFTYPSLLGGQ